MTQPQPATQVCYLNKLDSALFYSRLVFKSLIFSHYVQSVLDFLLFIVTFTKCASCRRFGFSSRKRSELSRFSTSCVKFRLILRLRSASTTRFSRPISLSVGEVMGTDRQRSDKRIESVVCARRIAVKQVKRLSKLRVQQPPQ